MLAHLSGAHTHSMEPFLRIDSIHGCEEGARGRRRLGVRCHQLFGSYFTVSATEKDYTSGAPLSSADTLARTKRTRTSVPVLYAVVTRHSPLSVHCSWTP